MAPKTTQQFEQIRQSRKAALIKAAMELFANNGFKGTSISSISKKAGVSKGLIYNYFENKEALVKEIILEGMTQMVADLNFDFNQKITRSRFIVLIDKNLDLIKKNNGYWKLYTAVITQPAVVDLVKGDIFQIIGPFIIAITKYYEEKGVKNPIAYGYLFASILDGIGLDYMFDPDNYPLKEVRDLIIEKLI